MNKLIAFYNKHDVLIAFLCTLFLVGSVTYQYFVRGQISFVYLFACIIAVHVFGFFYVSNRTSHSEKSQSADASENEVDHNPHAFGTPNRCGKCNSEPERSGDYVVYCECGETVEFFKPTSLDDHNVVVQMWNEKQASYAIEGFTFPCKNFADEGISKQSQKLIDQINDTN